MTEKNIEATNILANKQMTEKNPQYLYQNRNFLELSKSDLTKPIDDNGNTIVHLMAKNLDKAPFESILEHNPSALTYSVMNFQNKEYKTPLNQALQEINQRREISQDFIDYMISLGANPDIPDANNRIITNINQSKNQTSVYNLAPSIDELDDIVTTNIKKLVSMAEKGIDDFSSLFTNNLQKNVSPTSSMNSIDFIKNITNRYASNSKMNVTGGYSGKRKIRQHFSDLSITDSANDSFVAKSKNKLLNNYNRNADMANSFSEQYDYTHDNEDTEETRYNANLTGIFEERENLEREEARLRREEEKIRNERLMGGDSSSLRKQESSIRNKRVELEKKLTVNMLGGIGCSMTGGDFLEEMNRVKKEEEELNLRAEKLRNMRLIGGNHDDKIRQEEKIIIDKLNNLHKKISGMVGGKKNQRKTFMDDWNTEDLEALLTDENRSNLKNNSDMDTPNLTSYGGNSDVDWDDSDDSDSDDSDKVWDTKSSNMRFGNSNDSDDDSDDDFDNDAGDDDDDDSDSYTYQERPRDEKADEMYRSFVTKIMDLLGVDMETAKFYRSALKINIENKNPELKKRINNSLKVKEMENIFENKSKLQASLDQINMDEIKKYMAMQKEKGEVRQQESIQRKKEKNKLRKKNRGNKVKIVESIDSTTSSESVKEKPVKKSVPKLTTTEPEETPKPKAKRVTKKKIAENGYLQSDEIIFSSDY